MVKVIAIDGNAASLSAASQIKRQHPLYEMAVYEKGFYLSYGTCGVPLVKLK